MLGIADKALFEAVSNALRDIRAPALRACTTPQPLHVTVAADIAQAKGLYGNKPTFTIGSEGGSWRDASGNLQSYCDRQAQRNACRVCSRLLCRCQCKVALMPGGMLADARAWQTAPTNMLQDWESWRRRGLRQLSSLGSEWWPQGGLRL